MYNLGRPQTPDPPASASWALGLQIHATTPRFRVAVTNQELPSSEEFFHDGIMCAKMKCWQESGPLLKARAGEVRSSQGRERDGAVVDDVVPCWP